MKKTYLLCGAFVLAFFLLWITRFHYERLHFGGSERLVRINRYTDQICYAQPDGTWNSLLSPPIVPQPLNMDDAQSTPPVHIHSSTECR